MPGLEPLLIPRAEHCVSRANISPNALRVMQRLNDAGYESYLVGGAVRDLLLGGRPKDFDVATDARPEEIRALFRNCRLIGRRFRLAHVHFGAEIVEVATFRGDADGDERTEINGLLVRDNVYGTLEEDALRRDFTVNALYYGITDFALRDYAGGYADIQQRQLRLIGDPRQRYTEDPVRMLRAARLAAKLDFRIDPATADPIPGLAGLLEEAAPARLFDECLKLFLSGHARASWEWLERLQLVAALFPETAQRLAEDRHGGARDMLLAALDNTDARIREGKPVTPAFLFAALLWEPYRRRVIDEVRQGRRGPDAEEIAADLVTAAQMRRVALPKRFALPMREIWTLQSRFDEHQRKRVQRFLVHPRFRACYDFLELRCLQSPELREVYDWWTAVQHRGIDAMPAEAGLLPSSSRKRKRRRPRRQPPVATH